MIGREGEELLDARGYKLELYKKKGASGVDREKGNKERYVRLRAEYQKKGAEERATGGGVDKAKGDNKEDDEKANKDEMKRTKRLSSSH